MLESAYLFSGQYHGQCPHHSAADSANDVIQGGSVLLFWLNFIKIFDPAVNTIVDRLPEAFDNSFSGGSPVSGNGDL
jgi:hypothetical protein